jgi:hypothetical protein
LANPFLTCIKLHVCFISERYSISTLEEHDSGVKKYKAALNTDVKEYVTNIMMRKKENNKNNN